ncbi:hypothetical protein EV379_3408 [Microterricola gilva]|uniref:Uncharacterized protein n=1 Tax=Microterricola gilva TaxID=393267 RepID=A0A4Q8AS71_9MICO|nr:hypothetical protein [Microterricola gilva]RZU67033.1 hypothetical protein EV379_3408 [Microterricola gilva]
MPESSGAGTAAQRDQPLTEDHQMTEAQKVADIIARTSTEFSGRAEAMISATLIARFAESGLDISSVEAARVAHDIALAPKLRDTLDD